MTQAHLPHTEIHDALADKPLPQRKLMQKSPAGLHSMKGVPWTKNSVQSTTTSNAIFQNKTSVSVPFPIGVKQCSRFIKFAK